MRVINLCCVIGLERKNKCGTIRWMRRKERFKSKVDIFRTDQGLISLQIKKDISPDLPCRLSDTFGAATGFRGGHNNLSPSLFENIVPGTRRVIESLRALLAE